MDITLRNRIFGLAATALGVAACALYSSGQAEAITALFEPGKLNQQMPGRREPNGCRGNGRTL